LAQAETPSGAAAAAGERRKDVFMGIDCFGRGTYAGGQLNCSVAAAAARREGDAHDSMTYCCRHEQNCSVEIYLALSMALFIAHVGTERGSMM